MEREGEDPSSVMEKQGGERKRGGGVRFGGAWRKGRGSGHGVRSSWGPWTRAVRGRAAAAREQQRRVTHGGGSGIEHGKGWPVGRPAEWVLATERKGGQSHYGWTGPEERSQLAGKEREKGRLPCGARGV
jgi:hypothetical protein